MKKWVTLSNVTNVALLTVALILLARMFYHPAPSEAVVPDAWEQELATGISVGPDDAPIRIVEFMDFQCPFCRLWSARLDSLLSDHPSAMRVTFHHMPITGLHPHAMSAAIASECADRQARFATFARALYAEQAQIGIRPWREFAGVAGVPDLDAFEACTALPSEAFPRIQYGIALAQRTRVVGTPTVWINGKVQRPTLEELRTLAREVAP